jgi:hypothetical protein
MDLSKAHETHEQAHQNEGDAEFHRE